MKIDTTKIPLEGLTLRQDFSPGELDLDTAIIKFRGPIRVEAKVFKVMHALTLHLHLSGLRQASCGRCLKEFESEFKKESELYYPLDGAERMLDLDPDIRDEIILDYPVKPLCVPDCRGLCPQCGKNLNEGGCSCGST